MAWQTQFKTKYSHFLIRRSEEYFTFQNTLKGQLLVTRTNVKILKFLWAGNFLFQCILVLILIYPGVHRDELFF